MANHSIFLLAKLHGQRSLAGYSPWDFKESDTTEHTYTHMQAGADCVCVLPTGTRAEVTFATSGPGPRNLSPSFEFFPFLLAGPAE